MDLVVMIATSGARPDMLARTLTSLSECDIPAGYRETIVIENGGSGHCRTLAEQADDDLSVRYVFREEGNKSAALNENLPEDNETFVVFLDDDVRVQKDFLSQYARAAVQHGQGHFYGGPVDIDYEGDPPPPWLRSLMPPSHRGWQPSPDQDRDHLTFLGANWAAFVVDLRKVNGFDTSRGPGLEAGGVGEETVIQRALISEGCTSVYVPDALIWHFVPAERCTDDWVASRMYRHGLGAGKGLAGRSGEAFWRDKYNALKICIWWILSTMTGREQFRARWKIAIQWRSGVRDGFTLAASERSAGNKTT